MRIGGQHQKSFYINILRILVIGTIDVCHITGSDLLFKPSTLNWRIIRDNKRKFVADDSKTMVSDDDCPELVILRVLVIVHCDQIGV